MFPDLSLSHNNRKYENTNIICLQVFIEHQSNHEAANLRLLCSSHYYIMWTTPRTKEDLISQRLAGVKLEMILNSFPNSPDVQLSTVRQMEEGQHRCCSASVWSSCQDDRGSESSMMKKKTTDLQKSLGNANLTLNKKELMGGHHGGRHWCLKFVKELLLLRTTG